MHKNNLFIMTANVLAIKKNKNSFFLACYSEAQHSILWSILNSKNV